MMKNCRYIKLLLWRSILAPLCLDLVPYTELQNHLFQMLLIISTEPSNK